MTPTTVCLLQFSSPVVKTHKSLLQGKMVKISQTVTEILSSATKSVYRLGYLPKGLKIFPLWVFSTLPLGFLKILIKDRNQNII